MKRIWNNRGVILFGIVICIIVFCQRWDVVIAASQAIYSRNGTFIFETIDTKATSGTRWITIGFTIRRDKCNGNPMKDKKYAIIEMKNSYRTVILNKDGTYTQTFTIPRKDIETALIDSQIADIGTENILYLNGIFKVSRDGAMDRATYRTLTDIKSAADWKNKKDFEDFFDIQVTFEMDKYPIYIEYRTNKGDVISTTKTDMIHGGKKISKTLDSKKTYKGVEYELYSSYIQYLENPGKKVNVKSIRTGQTLDSIRKRQATQGVDGLKIIGVMKQKQEKKDVGEETKIEEVIDSEIESIAVVGADQRYQEAFDVSQGIPSTESLYVNVRVPEYLVAYEFQKHTGKKKYSIHIEKTYQLRWKEEKEITNSKSKKKEIQYIDHNTTKIVEDTYYEERVYTYWSIEKLVVATPKMVTIENQALPEGSILVEPKGPSIPSIDYIRYGNEKSHLVEPEYERRIVLPTEVVVGQKCMPETPEDDFQDIAKKKIGKIKVRNDKVLFQNKTIMSDVYKQEKTDVPLRMPICEGLTGEDVFYKCNLKIPFDKGNGIYKSAGNVIYKYLVHVGEENKQPKFEMSDINEVIVHTPTVCNGAIEDKYRLCQQINPNGYCASLVLDGTFQVALPTEGQHINAKGYCYNDYKKYMAKRQVKFPFDVYQGAQYFGKDEWIDVDVETQFYLPQWVNEGMYQVDFRCISINGLPEDRMEKEEEYCNDHRDNYVAVDSIPVEVSGRLYGFQIYDISDYPVWQSVFRQKSSLKLTGFCFGVNQFPLMSGSHPYVKNYGMVKPGYVFRMSLITIGNMDSIKDYIRILPSFYYVDRDGKNRREVELYYTETFGGKQKNLIRIGSEVDKENVKELNLGDNFLSVSKDEIRETALIKNIREKELKEQKNKLFHFSNIMIPSKMQTLIGAHYLKQKGIAKPYNIDSKQVASSVQKWYFEYYLPAHLYVAPKNYDLRQYAKKNSIDFSEDFWLKEGNVLLNFDIETIQKEKRHLSYINNVQEVNGYCNMWKEEGFQKEKIDSQGKKIFFQDGDLCLITLKNSAATDYQSGGSH